MTFSDNKPRFQGHGVTIGRDALYSRYVSDSQLAITTTTILVLVFFGFSIFQELYLHTDSNLSLTTVHNNYKVWKYLHHSNVENRVPEWFYHISVGRHYIGSVGQFAKKCPPRGSVRVRTLPRGLDRVRSTGQRRNWVSDTDPRPDPGRQWPVTRIDPGFFGGVQTSWPKPTP